MNHTKWKLSYGVLVLVGLIATIGISGCTAHFMSDGQFQWNLSSMATEPTPLLTEFQVSEDAGVAGDITDKSGSSCAGGVCTIY